MLPPYSGPSAAAAADSAALTSDHHSIHTLPAPSLPAYAAARGKKVSQLTWEVGCVWIQSKRRREDAECYHHYTSSSVLQVTMSVIACLSYVTMGGLMGLLGPAIPSLAQYLGKLVGYMCGCREEGKQEEAYSFGVDVIFLHDIQNTDVEETSLGGAFASRAGGYIVGSLLVPRLPEKGCLTRVGIMAVTGVLASTINMCIPHR